MYLLMQYSVSAHRPAATTTAALGDGSTTGGITLDVDGAISIGAAVLTTGAVTVTLFLVAFQNLC